VASGIWLGDPELHSVKSATVVVGVFFSVDHPITGAHEVQLSRLNELLGPEGVFVQELSGKDPSRRLKSDVGVRSNIDRYLGVKLGRAHVIHKAPSANGSTSAGGERSPDVERSHRGLPARKYLNLASGR